MRLAFTVFVGAFRGALGLRFCQVLLEGCSATFSARHPKQGTDPSKSAPPCWALIFVGSMRLVLVASAAAEAAAPTSIQSAEVSAEAEARRDDERRGRVRLAFASARRVDDETQISFALHNGSGIPAPLATAFIEQDGQRLGQLLRLTSAAIPADGYEFGVIVIPRLATDSQLVLMTAATGGHEDWRFAINLEGTLEKVVFSRDCTTLTIYGVSKAKSTPNACVNGAPAKLLESSVLPLPSALYFHSLVVAAPRHIQNGDRVLVECAWPQEPDEQGTQVRLGAMQRAFSPFTIGASQYCFPLRVVSATSIGEWVKVQLYNESTAAKPELQIDRVRLNGYDVTERCRLPSGPLPADRQRYDADRRALWMPQPWDETEVGLLTLDYHLLPAAQLLHAVDTGAKRLEVGLRKGVGLPIGVAGSPILAGAVCLHAGGLRPDLERPALRMLARSLATGAPEIPTYLRMSELASPRDTARMAPFADFVVVGPSQRMKADGLNAAVEFLRFHDALRQRGVRFISTITKDADSHFSADDARWMCLAALFKGSEGVLLQGTPGDATTEPILPEDVEKVSPFLNTACPVALHCTSNHDGIDTSCVALSTDRLAVRALNCWTTRASQQGSEPFYAVRRGGVEVTVHVGTDWVHSLDVVDLSTQEPLPCTFGENGDITIQFPAFRLGRIAIIARTPKEAARAETATATAFLAERADTVAVRSLESPFLKLPAVETRTAAHFKLALQNDEDVPVDICAADVSAGASRLWRLNCDPICLPPHGSGVLEGQLVAPAVPCQTVVRLSLISRRNSAEVLQAFLDVRSFAALRADPVEVDFGLVRSAASPSWRKIRVLSKPSGAKVNRVFADGDVAVDFRITSDGTAVEFAPRIERNGRYSSRLTIEVCLVDNVNTRTLIVPFHVERVDALRVLPAELILVQSATAQTRTIRLIHPTGARLVVKDVSVSDARVAVEQVERGRIGPAELKVIIAPEVSEDAKVCISMADGDGNAYDVTVPVRVVARVRVHSAAEGSSAELRAAFALTSDILRRFQEFSLPAHTPSWLVFHRLLMFGDSSTTSRDFKIAVADAVSRDSDAVPPFVRLNGRIAGNRGGSQFEHEHHRDQFLQYLALAGVPPDTELTVSGKPLRVRDILHDAKWYARERGELCWTAGALARYLKPGEVWRNRFDEQLSVGDLYRGVLAWPNPTCGGTHQLCSIACALSRPELRREEKLDQIWPQLEQAVAKEIRILRLLQRPDGSFALPKLMQDDPRLRDSDVVPFVVGIHYTGHTLEWMAIGLRSEELREPWVLRAVRYLTAAIDAQFPYASEMLPFNTSERCMNYGFVAHAVSALQRWHSKVYRE